MLVQQAMQLISCTLLQRSATIQPNLEEFGMIRFSGGATREDNDA